jgi:hypothetical protein
MVNYARALVLIAVVCLTASCSDADEDARLVATQPSLVGTRLVSVTPTSSTLVAQPVRNSFCPTVAPFIVSGGVVVTQNSAANVVITSMRLLFTDSLGRQASPVTLPSIPVTLPAPGPTLQFGSAQIPFTLGIGCGTGTNGTLIIVVDTSDDRGRPDSHQVRVVVR